MLGAGFAVCAFAQDQKPDRLMINDDGGAYDDVLRAAVWDPFEKQTGIKIQSTSPADYGKLKAMVESGNPTWDIAEIDGEDALRAVQAGLAEPIDDKVVDRSKFVSAARDPYVFSTTVYSTVFGYRTDTFPSGAPTSWKDFWDVKRFPGPRAMEDGPAGNLEFALLADGVKPDKLYPLDVDRAFKKLDEIYPSVSVWWKTGQQPIQLLVDKEVVLSTAWNTRLYNAIKKGAPLAIQWNGGLSARGSWVIPKGTKNKEYAMKLFAFMTDPKNQAQVSIGIGSSGANLDANNYIPADTLKLLPLSPENAPKQVWLNEEWWAKNGDAVNERWNKWKLSKGG
jgi:putative spermidine/putrescine transport system substrate-binding protein